MSVKISACLIAKNEEDRIERALKSIVDHVDEIIVVDTGSTDRTVELASKYAKVVTFTECNHSSGEIMNFSMARQKSFDLAQHDWVVWMDADDEVVGAEQFREIAELHAGPTPVAIMFPYEYAYDDKNKPSCVLYRERLLNPRKAYEWKGAVHEVLMPIGPNARTTYDNRIVYKHHREGKLTNQFRNLNILRHAVEKGDEDPRTLYYLGQEYYSVGNTADAIKAYTKYLQLSGWNEERCSACLKLSDIHCELGDYDTAADWAFKALRERESWGETYFQLGKCFYFAAQRKKASGQEARLLWERSVNFFNIGISLPPTKTVLFINPMQRKFEIHRFLNIALNELGDVAHALDSVNMALRENSDDVELCINKRVYEEHLARESIKNQLRLLESNKVVEPIVSEAVMSLLSGRGRAIPVQEGKQDEMVQRIEQGPTPQEWPDYFRVDTYPKGIKAEHFPKAVVSPHPQAWGIPESYVIDDLPLRMNDKQLQALIVTLWKEYLLHDEVLSAKSLLLNAPYRVRHTPETEELVRLTDEMYQWNNDPELLQKHNTPIDVYSNKPLGFEMVPLDGPPLGAQALNRMNWMGNRFAPGSTVCDLACIDGEMTNRWALMGFKVTGVDICKSSVEIANAAAERHHTGARHVLSTFADATFALEGELFDNVTCGDIYEHMIDPVKDLLIPARQLVKPTGQLLLTAPYGAWFRGEFNINAHPWLRGDNENHHWLADHRGHLVAPTVWSVVDHCRQAGWWVDTAVVQQQVPVPGWDADHQGNVCIRGLPISPKQGLDIVMFLGDGVEMWTPYSINLTGIGGSEMAAVQMAKRLVQLGHRVRVYSGCTQHGEGIYDGVEYRISEKFINLKCDVLISSRMAQPLGEPTVEAKARVLWVHDVGPHGMTRELALKCDYVFALSEWHKSEILRLCPVIDPAQILVTRNGIDINRFSELIQRNPHKVVYSSSPDRGLPALLQMWPRIRAAVPDAELHVYYGFKNWLHWADAGQKKLITEIQSIMDSLSSQGVIYRGRVPQQDLAQEFMGAGAWLYPTWFTETSCITAMEAQAAGLRIVTSPIAALQETVGTRGTMIRGDWLSKEYQDQFTEAAIQALTKPEDYLERDKLRAFALLNFNWDDVAISWSGIFKELVNKSNAGHLSLPYRSR